MKISTYLVDTIKNQFEVFCIRVLQNEARDCYRELERMSKKESLFSELKIEQLNRVGAIQEFDSDFYLFNVNGYEIRIKDALIAKQLVNCQRKNKTSFYFHFFWKCQKLILLDR